MDPEFGAELIRTLGGDAGFGENILARNDDGSTSRIELDAVFEHGLNFFGVTWTGLFVNNNGSVTFDRSLSTFTPSTISSGTTPGIFPFWGDVDTRGGEAMRTPGGASQGTNLVWYDLDPENGRFTATWDDVGYFSSSIDRLNAFQLVITDASDDPGRRAGDFDIQFRYEEIDWTAGNASGGSGGLGGVTARAGYSAGDAEGTFFELPASGDEGQVRALDVSPGNTGRAGIWEFEVRNGDIPAAFSVRNAGAVTEGDDGTTAMEFVVSRFGNASVDATISYVLAGLRGAGSDDIVGALPRVGEIVFEPGETEKIVTVEIMGDEQVESDEVIRMTLTDATSSDPEANVQLGVRQAGGLILDDDRPVRPVRPRGRSADGYGDPHLTTLDGLGYDFQAVGEFTLIESTAGDPLQVQVRTSPLTDVVSIITAVAARVSGRAVTIDVDGGGRVLVDGEEVEVSDMAPLVLGTAAIYREDDVYTLVHPNGEQVEVELLDGFMNVRAFLNEDRAPGSVRGLLGNGDGDAANDLALPDGALLAQPLDFDTLYSVYADAWRIAEEDALFSREAGETTADFQDPSYPRGRLTSSDLPASVLSAATAAVNAAGITDPVLREAAILDVALTGNTDFATGAAALGAVPMMEVTPEGAPELGETIGVTASSARQPEGDGGTTGLIFDLYRVGDVSAARDVRYQVAGDVDAADFGGTIPSGVVSFAEGQSAAELVIALQGDRDPEADETLRVVISLAEEDEGQALLAATSAATVVENDDGEAPGTLSIARSSENAAEGGSVEFTVTRSGSTLEAVSAQVAILGGTAMAADFAGGALPVFDIALAPGEEETTVAVDIAVDGMVETNESFRAVLQEVSGALVGTGEAGATILGEGEAPGIPADAVEDGPLSLSALSVVENAAPGLAVATVRGAEGLALSLVDDGSGDFVLEGDRLLVSAGAMLDFEAAAARRVIIRATESNDDTFSQVFEIALTDVDEAPEIAGPGPLELAEDAAPGTVLGPVSAVDPEGEAAELTLRDDFGGIFAIEDGALVLARRLDFETATEHALVLEASDPGGLTSSFEIAVTVADVDDAAVDDADGDGVLEGDGGPNTLTGGDRDQVFTGGAGPDDLRLGGGANRIVDTLANFDGDVIFDFGTDDVLQFVGEGRLTRDDFSIVFGSAVITVGGVAFTLEGDFSGGDFMAWGAGDGDTQLGFRDYRAALSETASVEAEEINGIVAPRYLNGDTATAFSVTVETGAGAEFDNAIGVYQLDAGGAVIEGSVAFLAPSAQTAAATGAALIADGIAPGAQLGFFLVSDGANALDPSVFEADELIFVDIGGGALGLSLDGGAAEDVDVWFSHDAAANADGVEHVLSGVADDGSGALRIGFEDLPGGGDRDYQDVLLFVEIA